VNQLTVLSLFSGIGGLELGLERAGMTTVGQVEIDPFCRKILEKHWPEVPKHDDVRTTVGWWQSQRRPRVDVVCGGFPCQPFSGAGLQLGVADERWGWPWFADVVRRVRPRYVVVENVSALLRHRDAFGWLLGDLHSFGFDAEWSVISACSLGASHPRNRLFIVAYSRGSGLQGLHQAGGRVDLQSVAASLRRNWTPEPKVDRVAYGIPRRLVRDDLHALGNAVVPQVAEYVGRLIVAAEAEVAA
jgi:DNA (cytosine-5)-methyltransferase 1